MVYCISDIHGDFESYEKMLRKLHLTGRDTLYVLGNVIDGGQGSMDILLDMMMRENVFPVIGDHEFAALSCLKWLMKDVTKESFAGMDKGMMQRMTDWAAIGGSDTIAQFRELTDEQKEMVVDYLSDFSLYEEVEAAGKVFVLVHAGISNFDEEKDIDDYDIHELITQSPDYKRVYYKDKYLVTGHMPTRRIFEAQNPLIEHAPDGELSEYDRIFVKNNHIAINCGLEIGGRLGAVRLDDMAEFYV